MAAEDYFDIDGDPYGPEFDNDTPDYQPPYDVCPKCGNPLVERTRRRDGHKFFGCVTYPSCDFTCAVEDTKAWHDQNYVRECEIRLRLAKSSYEQAKAQAAHCLQKLSEAQTELSKARAEIGQLI